MERLRVAIQKARESRGAAPAGVQNLSGGQRRVTPVWDLLQGFEPEPARTAASRIVTIDRSDPAHATFDMLRTRILSFLREKSLRTIGITSPQPGCGKSTVALNLAFSLARQEDVRTALIDLDMRRPAIARMIGAAGWSGIDAYFEGTEPLETCFRRYRDNLAIAINGGGRANPAEILQSKQTGDAIKTLYRDLRPDVVLVDLPPLRSCDDVWAFLPNLDCVLLIAAADQSTFEDIDSAERELSEKTTLLGVILNQCRMAEDTAAGSYHY
jgi:Mrp family chromosome partitioning ATPase